MDKTDEGCRWCVTYDDDIGIECSGDVVLSESDLLSMLEALDCGEKIEEEVDNDNS